MIIDYISDIHEDYQGLTLDKYNIKKFIGELNPKGEILLIAGDISDDIYRAVEFLRLTLKLFDYKKIFFVTGNHELYGLKYSSYKEKIKELKNLLKEHPNLVLLDGQVENYNGIRIGGCMMWYDGSYSKYFDERKDLQKIWENYMPDAARINGIDHYKDPFFEENKKLKKIYKDVDIIVSHISPLCHPSFVNKRFVNDITTSFYYFDGEQIIKNTTAKHWVFGHIHSKLEAEVKGVKFHCNPKGYRSEAERTQMKQIIF